MINILNEISAWHPQSGERGVVLKNVVSDYSALVIQRNMLVLFRIRKPYSVIFASTLLVIVSRFLMGTL